MKTKRLIVAASIYGLFLGLAISTGHLTAEIVVKGWLVVLPPAAIALFLKDTEHHRVQNRTSRELRDVYRKCASMQANEGALYLKIVSAREELVVSRQQTIFLREEMCLQAAKRRKRTVPALKRFTTKPSQASGQKTRLKTGRMDGANAVV